MVEVWSEMESVGACCLWKAQMEFYDTHGMDSWQVVPEYMSNNSFLAHRYALLILHFLRDLRTTNQLTQEPLHIMEIGAGTGKLAFLILTHLQQLRQNAFPDLQSVPIKYILTDFTESIVRCWETNGNFTRWVEEGMVDFALLDANTFRAENGMLLRAAGGPWKMDSGYLICIANYLFDSLKHDAFAVQPETGTLEEWKVTISSDIPPSQAEFLPSVIGTSCMKWDLSPIRSLDEPDPCRHYVHEEYLNRILSDYQTELGKRGASLVLPVGSLRLMAQLRSFSMGRMCVIAGDKAHSHAYEFDEHDEPPEIVSHDGCFSFTANFDAVAKFFRLYGGFSHHMDTDSRFRVSIFVMDTPSTVLATSILPMEEEEKRKHRFLSLLSAVHSSSFAAEDYFALYEGAEAFIKQVRSLERRVTGLRREKTVKEHLRFISAKLTLSCYDVDLFLMYQEALGVCLDLLEDDDDCPALQKILYRVWAHDYYVPSLSSDVPFALGQIFQSLDCATSAAKFFDLSVQRFPDEPLAALYNLGVCYVDQEQWMLAKSCFVRCRGLDPDDADVLEKLELVESHVPEELPSRSTKVPTKPLTNYRVTSEKNEEQEETHYSSLVERMNARNKQRYA